MGFREWSDSTLHEATVNVLDVLKDLININTIMITSFQGKVLTIEEVLNKEYSLFSKHEQLLIQQTFWMLTKKDGREPYIIHNIEDHEEHLELGGEIKSYIGAPIILADGTVYGNLCAVDRKPFYFEEKHIRLFREMATLYGKVLDLEEVSNRDHLTRLYNRRSLQTFFSCWTEEGRGKRPGVGLLFIDINGFKKINDAYGHHMGDAVLIDISETINLFSSETVKVFRASGDEFVMLISNVIEEKSLKLLGETVKHALGQLQFPNMQITVTCSIGSAMYRSAESLSSLLNRADQEMYREKNENRKHLL